LCPDLRTISADPAHLGTRHGEICYKIKLVSTADTSFYTTKNPRNITEKMTFAMIPSCASMSFRETKKSSRLNFRQRIVHRPFNASLLPFAGHEHFDLSRSNAALRTAPRKFLAHRLRSHAMAVQYLPLCWISLGTLPLRKKPVGRVASRRSAVFQR
jgi:hypothetical protein